MTVIPGLPDHLAEVPHDRHEWARWRDAIRVHRLQLRAAAEHDRGLQEHERDKSAHSCAYWLTVWNAFFDPRHRVTPVGEFGGPTPAILYGYQVGVLDWLDARMKADKFQGREDNDGVISKPRDMGISWLLAADDVHRFVFEENYNALYMSYREDLVNGPTPRSAFWKMMFLLGHRNTSPTGMPVWMRPAGFDPIRHYTSERIENPDNGSFIEGESTTKRSARGSRYSKITLDEHAFMSNGGVIWANATYATDHRISSSTENLDYGSHHRDLWQGRKKDPATVASVLELDWWQRPEFDQDWYDREQKQAEREGTIQEFRAEVDRDPFAARSSEWYYPLARELTEYSETNPTGQLGDFPYDPDGGEVACTIDPGAKDPTAILWVQHVPNTPYWNVIEAYDRAGMPVEYYGGLMNGTLPSMPHFQPDMDALAVLDVTSALRARHVTYYGDPDLAKKTFNDIDPALAKLLRMGIVVNLATQGGARNHPVRRSATISLLPRLRWNTSSPRVARALDAVQRSEFEAKNANATTEAMRPKHDQHSHYRSALEYLAVNLDRPGGDRRARGDREAGPYRMRRGQRVPVRSTYRPRAMTGL